MAAQSGGPTRLKLRTQPPVRRRQREFSSFNPLSLGAGRGRISNGRAARARGAVWIRAGNGCSSLRALRKMPGEHAVRGPSEARSRR
jgi:hypothetical protein